MSDWTQSIQIEWKNPANILTNVNAGASDLVRVTVSISHGGKSVLSSGWLVAKKDGET
jgi:hypothetical protein